MYARLYTILSRAGSYPPSLANMQPTSAWICLRRSHMRHPAPKRTDTYLIKLEMLTREPGRCCTRQRRHTSLRTIRTQQHVHAHWCVWVDPHHKMDSVLRLNTSSDPPCIKAPKATACPIFP